VHEYAGGARNHQSQWRRRVTIQRSRGYNSRTAPDSEVRVAAASKKRLKTFYASLHVTRIEDWCVKAETEEEARALLANGAGERCRIGDCVYVEVGEVSN
jgi:hypothetical protein